MGLIAGKCPNCGANLKISEGAKGELTCPFCGGTYVVENAVNIVNNETINNNNFAGANINIVGADFDNLMTNVINSFEENDIENAYNKVLKALEINPNDKKAIIYKALCGAILKRNFTGVQKTFSNIVGIDYTNYEEDIKYCEILLRIIASENKSILQDFTTEYDGMELINRAWKGLDILLETSLILKNCVFKMYQNEKAFESIYLDTLKVVSSICDELTQKWKRLMPIDYRYHVGEYHPQREVFLAEKKKAEEEIKSIDTTYEPKEKEGSSGGCYVATCVYGSYDCPQVWILRRYRDNKLAKTWYGRAFIHTYYAISPTLVKWFGKTKWFKKMWQGKLDKMVKKLQEQGFESTPYQDKKW